MIYITEGIEGKIYKKDKYAFKISRTSCEICVIKKYWDIDEMEVMIKMDLMEGDLYDLIDRIKIDK